LASLVVLAVSIAYGTERARIDRIEADIDRQAASASVAASDRARLSEDVAVIKARVGSMISTVESIDRKLDRRDARERREDR